MSSYIFFTEIRNLDETPNEVYKVINQSTDIQLINFNEHFIQQNIIFAACLYVNNRNNIIYCLL